MKKRMLFLWSRLRYNILVGLLAMSAFCTRMNSNNFKVVAYQKYNTLRSFDFHSGHFIDELVYKLITIDADGNLKLRASTIDDINLLQSFKKQHNVELLIGVGGAKVNSMHFPAMAASEKARIAFIHNLIDFCNKHQLDGADIDWEYPKSTKEKQDALLLFKELNKAFRNNNLKVTDAINYAPDQVLFAKRIECYVDQINLMAYEPMDGLDSFQEQFDYALNLVHANSLDKSKVVIGLPFYAKKKEDGKTMPYKQLCKLYEHENVAKKDYDFMSRSDIQSNVIMSMDEGLAGVMFWELGFDLPGGSPNSLVKCIDECR